MHDGWQTADDGDEAEARQQRSNAAFEEPDHEDLATLRRGYSVNAPIPGGLSDSEADEAEDEPAEENELAADGQRAAEDDGDDDSDPNRCVASNFCLIVCRVVWS